MKLLFTYLFLLLIPFTLSANPIDSLKNILQDPKIKQETKLDTYNELAKAYSLTSMDSALAYNQKGLELAAQLPTSKSVVQAYIARASLLNGRYQSVEAQQAAEKALGLSRDISDKQTEAAALKELGLALKNATKFDSSKLVMQQAIELARKEKYFDIESASENVVAQIFGRLQQYDSSISHYQAAIDLGNKAGMVKQNLAPMYNMAIAHYNLGQFDSVKSILYRAIAIAQATQARRIQGAAHSVLANIYSSEGKFDSSLLHIEKGIGIADSLSVERMYGYYNLADLYLQEQDFGTSLNYWELALGQAEGINSIAQADILRGMGQLYLEWGKLDSAILYLDRAEVTSKKFGSAESLGQLRLYRAQALAEQGKYQEAIKSIEPALSAKEASIALQGNLRKGLFLQKLNRYQEAKTFLQQALSKAQEIKQTENVASAYYYLAKGDSMLGNSSSALRYKSLYADEEIRRLKERYKESVAEFETKFETAQKEAQIKSLEQDNRIQELEISQTTAQRNALLGIVGIFVLAGAIILALFVRLRQQREALIQANATKDRLFSIISHDLRGPITGLQTVGRIFTHHLDKGNVGVLKAISQQLDQQTGQVRRLLDNLLTWSLQQLGVYESKEETFHFEEFGSEILGYHQQSADAKGIELRLEVDPQLQIQGDRRGLNVVLTNLLNNAIKYTDQGSISLSAAKKEGKILISVVDTGQGMSAERVDQLMAGQMVSSERGTLGEQGTGLGWQIVHELVNRWDGKVEIISEPEKGTEVRIWM